MVAASPWGRARGRAAALPGARCAPASLVPLGSGQLAGNTSKLLKPAGREARGSGQRPAGVGIEGGHGDAAGDGKGKTALPGKGKPSPFCTTGRRSRREEQEEEEIQPLFCLWPKLRWPQKPCSVCASSPQAAPKPSKPCRVSTNGASWVPQQKAAGIWCKHGCCRSPRAALTLSSPGTGEQRLTALHQQLHKEIWAALTAARGPHYWSFTCKHKI